MANTYDLLASSTVGSGGSATVNFTSINQTYTDLILKTSTNYSSLYSLLLRFNSNSTNVYTQTVFRGTGTAANSYANTGWSAAGSFALSYQGDTSNVFSNNEYYIPNYAGATYKNLSNDSVHEADTSTAYKVISACLFSDTTAITSINLIAETGSFAQYSTFYLYGIKNS